MEHYIEHHRPFNGLVSHPAGHTKYSEGYDTIYDVFLVTAKPLGVVRRASDEPGTGSTFPRRNIRFVTPDGVEHKQLTAAANHLLEAQ